MVRDLRVRRIERSAFCATDRQVVDLILFGVHQDRAALPTHIVGRVVARVKDRRGADEFSRRHRYRFQTNLRMNTHAPMLSQYAAPVCSILTTFQNRPLLISKPAMTKITAPSQGRC